MISVSPNYPHYAIGKYLQILNGTIIIELSASSISLVVRISATVPIDLTSMADSGTITSVARTTSTVAIELVNETDTVKDITIIPPISVRDDPAHERLVGVIKELVTCPITMQTYLNPVRCTNK